jgi:hypothetical protein
MPKAETPARRGRPGPPGQGRGATGTSKSSWNPATAGFGERKFRLGTSSPRSTHRAALTNPTMPAAGSRWPTFVFAEPTARGRVRASVRETSRSPASSAGSPMRVPVPWAST